MTINKSSQFVLVVKKDCPTCQLILPVIESLQSRFNSHLTLYIQDDPSFLPESPLVVDDSDLAFSYKNNIEVVPTLIRYENDKEIDRVFGWVKDEWRNFTGMTELGQALTPFKPGCGSLTQAPGMDEVLALRFGKAEFESRQLEFSEDIDLEEACFERGWSDGLPVVPPTPIRVLRMLKGSSRTGDQVLGNIPPDYSPCTVEKVAINAVMAGCKPEYFPVVLNAVEAALLDEFCLHGLLCTTYFSSPVVIVNGPMAKKVGMNGGVNALGQGNRANATIGRALQLVVRNVGGGRPGEIDRATLGNPGKYTFCFAEDESDEEWQTLAEGRGVSRDKSAISLFAGDGVQAVMDQRSRTPESLVKSIAQSLRVVANGKVYGMADAILVVSPEHRRIFREAGWKKPDVHEALMNELSIPGEKIVRGADGIMEGMPEIFKDKQLNKFRPEGLHIVSAGGTAGMFSAIISGWVATGKMGSQMVTREIIE
ncbi:thioredoxin family protein [Aurantivibrio infirmus]